MADAALLERTLDEARKGPVTVPAGQALALAAQLFETGRLVEAAGLCRQLLGARPRSAQLHNILGVTLDALGRGEEAVECLEAAIALAPRSPAMRANLGEVHRRAGRTEAATLRLREAVALDPAHVPALNNLGILAYEREDWAEAARCYRAAIAGEQGLAEAHNNLGNALRRMEDEEGARSAYEAALRLRPGYCEARNNLGALLQKLGDASAAEAAFRQAIGEAPDYLEPRENLAALCAVDGREAEALQWLGTVLRRDGQRRTALLQVARLQLKRGQPAAAEGALQRLLGRDGEDPDALTLLAQLRSDEEKFGEALTLLERALAADPRHDEAHHQRGVVLKSLGKLSEAEQAVRTALDCNPRLAGAYVALGDLVDFRREEALVAAMEALLEELSARGSAGSSATIPLRYALAKAYDDRGEHDRALGLWIAAGADKRAASRFDEEANAAFFASIAKAFPKRLFARRPFAGVSDARPLFIVGMPRSGSTLVEQILSSHPAVHGAGEVKHWSRALAAERAADPAFPGFPALVGGLTQAAAERIAGRYLAAVGAGAGEAARITDKLLTNIFHVGLLHLVFPEARFVHTRRDPVDTCLSAFSKLFKDEMAHSYDLGELGRYYRRYEALMAHWRKVLPPGVMLEVDYEAVVADTEGQARRLLDHAGLPWDEACLAFHRNDRPVRTASVAQVRRPIYTGSVARWRRYGDGLKPLLDALGRS